MGVQYNILFKKDIATFIQYIASENNTEFQLGQELQEEMQNVRCEYLRICECIVFFTPSHAICILTFSFSDEYVVLSDP